jgi:hypothetical protein
MVAKCGGCIRFKNEDFGLIECSVRQDNIKDETGIRFMNACRQYKSANKYEWRNHRIVLKIVKGG